MLTFLIAAILLFAVGQLILSIWNPDISELIGFFIMMVFLSLIFQAIYIVSNPNKVLQVIS